MKNVTEKRGTKVHELYIWQDPRYYCRIELHTTPNGLTKRHQLFMMSGDTLIDNSCYTSWPLGSGCGEQERCRLIELAAKTFTEQISERRPMIEPVPVEGGAV